MFTKPLWIIFITILVSKLEATELKRRTDDQPGITSHIIESHPHLHISNEAGSYSHHGESKGSLSYTGGLKGNGDSLHSVSHGHEHHSIASHLNGIKGLTHGIKGSLEAGITKSGSSSQGAEGSGGLSQYGLHLSDTKEIGPNKIGLKGDISHKGVNLSGSLASGHNSNGVGIKGIGDLSHIGFHAPGTKQVENAHPNGINEQGGSSHDLQISNTGHKSHDAGIKGYGPSSHLGVDIGGQKEGGHNLHNVGIHGTGESSHTGSHNSEAGHKSHDIGIHLNKGEHEHGGLLHHEHSSGPKETDHKSHAGGIKGDGHLLHSENDHSELKEGGHKSHNIGIHLNKGQHEHGGLLHHEHSSGPKETDHKSHAVGIKGHGHLLHSENDHSGLKEGGHKSHNIGIHLNKGQHEHGGLLHHQDSSEPKEAGHKSHSVGIKDHGHLLHSENDHGGLKEAGHKSHDIGIHLHKGQHEHGGLLHHEHSSEPKEAGHKSHAVGIKDDGHLLHSENNHGSLKEAGHKSHDIGIHLNKKQHEHGGLLHDEHSSEPKEAGHKSHAVGIKDHGHLLHSENDHGGLKEAGHKSHDIGIHKSGGSSPVGSHISGFKHTGHVHLNKGEYEHGGLLHPEHTSSSKETGHKLHDIGIKGHGHSLDLGADLGGSKDAAHLTHGIGIKGTGGSHHSLSHSSDSHQKGHDQSNKGIKEHEGSSHYGIHISKSKEAGGHAPHIVGIHGGGDSSHSGKHIGKSIEIEHKPHEGGIKGSGYISHSAPHSVGLHITGGHSHKGADEGGLSTSGSHSSGFFGKPIGIHLHSDGIGNTGRIKRQTSSVHTSPNEHRHQPVHIHLSTDGSRRDNLDSETSTSSLDLIGSKLSSGIHYLTETFECTPGKDCQKSVTNKLNNVVNGIRGRVSDFFSGITTSIQPSPDEH